ncbi:Na/Pi cotransporter family protein [Vibrio vulnificus]|uniref:Na/Pi cotransporter family protein n=1 Tax=Vibrio vulnificus TaxID=672 RepID=UPI0021D9762E|nr:Na/Pi cotransporter family protein [Vibrio vulnificus]EHK8974644.1 Na/Pi cotransporter family protein [Vibrio vulnificus]EHK9042031.1 Na/Pi cotransporter family protein [Vibrio vulnificus]ELP6121240.1 Na/Pi cotransporter family protein [Vibrio vulnificus]ELR8743602.1 Na/Pi cotransporter family protein [Vibrio vulnificus]
MMILSRFFAFLRSALFVLALFPSFPILADTGAQEIDYLPMTVGLLGGLAIFLYGMEKMSDALKRAAGNKMKQWLAKLTTNRVAGVLTGTGITAIIQSSSVTTVLLVGFISAGLMSLPQAVGVIMGANIGTTVTAQIIAFKVTKAALVMVAIGFMMFFTSKKETTQHYGNMLFGLGLIFLGMNLMSEAMAPLRSYQPFIDLMAHMDNLLLAILIAAAFTALVQSSSATTGIVIVLAGQGFIPLDTGIALAMGANIGTCVTAVLASIGKPREAVQAAAIHIIFNVMGVVIWLPLIGILSELAMFISPLHPELVGVERMAAELPRQIANANTLFNVLNTLIMLPFASVFVWLVRKLLPHTSTEKSEASIQTKYINDAFLPTPDIALDQAQLELGRVGRRVCNMLNMLPPLAPECKDANETSLVRESLNQIELIEEEVDQLHSTILSYLGRLRREPLSDAQSARQIKLISITDQLESIADLVVNSLLPLAYKALNDDIVVSPQMRTTLDTVQDKVNRTLLDCVNAIRRDDPATAQLVLNAKRELNSLIDAVLAHQAQRLSEEQPNRLRIFRYEMEWVETLKRIYTLTKRISKLQLRQRDISAETQN